MADEDELYEEILDEISGEDDFDDDAEDVGFDEIGARRRRRRRGRGPKKAKMYVPSASIGRIAPLGLTQPGANIGIGATAVFSAQVSRAAHIRRLLVSSDKPVSELTITSIKIGDDEQLLNGAVNGTLYDSNAQQGFMDNFTPLRDNATVTVTIQNNGIAAAVVAVGCKAAANR